MIGETLGCPSWVAAGLLAAVAGVEVDYESGDHPPAGRRPRTPSGTGLAAASGASGRVPCSGLLQVLLFG
jgi:hypothetical protein